MEKEIWRDVKGYEGYYQASSIGRIKSLKRSYVNSLDRVRVVKEKILMPILQPNLYLRVCLFKDKKRKYLSVHVVVAMAFLNHTPCGHGTEVDHINEIKSDNRVKNLQLLTGRENTVRSKRNGTSKKTGVSWSECNKKWKVEIYIKDKGVYLGRFKSEIKAANEYQRALKEFKEKGYITRPFVNNKKP